MPLQLRRGVEADRSSVTPEAGEPLWVTDTNKLYVGDGSTAGGLLVSGGTDSAAVIALIDSAYVQARQVDVYRDSAFVTTIVDSAYINARTNANIDSDAAIALIDSAYVQARQDYAYNSLTGAPTNVSSFTNDAGYTTFDSANASGLITTAINNLVDGAPAALDTLNEIAAALNDDDSAYGTLLGLINAKTDYDSANFTGQLAAASTTDLSEGTNLYYTTARADSDFDVRLATKSTTNITEGSNLYYTTARFDSDFGDNTTSNLAEGTNLYYTDARVTTLVDSAYVQARQADIYRDSGFVTNIIDSAYINARVSATDSAAVISIVTGTVDSAYVQARTDNGVGLKFQQFTFTADSGDTTFTGVDDFGRTLQYVQNKIEVFYNGILLSPSDYTATNGTSIVFNSAADSADNIIISSYTSQNLLDSIDMANIATATVDSAYVQARQTPQDFAYSSLTGAPTTVSSFTNDANYIATNDSATLASVTTTGNIIVGGNLQVNGTTVTVNATDLDVTDNMIYMNAGESAGSPTASIDVGWAANVNDQGSYEHVGLFRDATDQTFKVFQGYTLEPDAAVQINTGHASFALAPFAASTLTGVYQGFDSDVTAAGLATQTYVTSTIDSAYINARVVIPAAFDSADVIGIVDSAYIAARTSAGSVTVDSAAPGSPSEGDLWYDDTNTGQLYVYENSSWTSVSIPPSYLDSADVISLIDSAYINARVVIPAAFDSADVVGIVDSAYIAARTSAGTDSATVVSLITGTVDSAYVQARGGGVGLKFRQFTYTADSGNTTFSGADDNGTTLTYVAGKIEVFYNGILLTPSDYTATNGTSIVLDNPVDSADTIIVSSYTTTSELDSAAVTAVASTAVTSTVDSAYVQARQDYAYSSLTGAPTNVSTFTNDAGYTTYDSANFTGQLTSATGSSVQAYDANLTSFVSTFTLPTSDGTPNQVLVTNGSGTISFADQSGGLDSAATIALIDSAYVAARTSAGTDSATVVSLITGTVDSAYVAARIDSATVLALTGLSTSGITLYEYTATASQQTFSGTDDNSATLAYTAGNILVHRNGILLVSTVDYTATNGTSINLQAGADSGDTISITAYAPTLVNATETTITSTVQEADSGQTSFTISHTQDQILVFLNGILLKDSDDYTSNGSTIVLTSAADSGDQLTVHNFGKYGQAGYGNLTTSGTTSTFAGTLLSTGRIVENYAATGSIIDLSVANYFSHTAVADTTFSVVNTLDSDKVNSIVLELTNGGDHTITWWSGVTWAGGSAPTLTSSGTDIIGFYSYTGGTTWRGLVLAQAIA